MSTDPTLAAGARRGRLGGALLVSAFTALLVLPPVGHHLIGKSDEARFALLARDMIHRGAWFAAQVEGELYRNKPPLFPWSIAGSPGAGHAPHPRPGPLHPELRRGRTQRGEHALPA